MNILLAVHPKWSTAILDGSKIMELRRVTPTKLGKGDRVFLYETAPTCAIVGVATVLDMVTMGAVWVLVYYGRKTLERWTGLKASIREAEHYLDGAKSPCGIMLHSPQRFEHPIDLTEACNELTRVVGRDPGIEWTETVEITRPQSFVYVDPETADFIMAFGGGTA